MINEDEDDDEDDEIAQFKKYPGAIDISSLIEDPFTQIFDTNERENYTNFILK